MPQGQNFLERGRAENSASEENIYATLLKMESAPDKKRSWKRLCLTLFNSPKIICLILLPFFTDSVEICEKVIYGEQKRE